ncbi:unnamed protein product [Owenia fusiformis]|uniref:Exostosin GT47 domain-containing protein n=1 Tax=Owenia fusiformis TaxID=6347 RepID=A0A8J1TR05_OWEFU|nr:unnamed protein product [Owenia fusiformis]
MFTSKHRFVISVIIIGFLTALPYIIYTRVNIERLQSPQYITMRNNINLEADERLFDFIPSSGFSEEDSSSLKNKTADKIKIYIYQLDDRFNMNITTCLSDPTNKPLHGRGCNYFNYQGYGKTLETMDKEGYVVTSQCQFGLEPIFHNKLLRSGLVTKDASKADLFYIPYYAGLSCFCGRGFKTLEKIVWTIIKTSAFFKKGKPHFMALSTVQRDLHLGGWVNGCSFLSGRPRAEHMKFVIIEGAPSQPDLIPAPYPSYIHYLRPNAHVAIDNARPIHVLMAGNPMTAFRKYLKLELDDEYKKYKGTGRYSLCLQTHSVNYTRLGYKTFQALLTATMRNATFCLQPHGDTPTRKSFFDGLLSGCIPVIFTNHSAYYPFIDMQHAGFPYPYHTFTILLNEEDIMKNKRSVLKLLGDIPTETIRKMQERIVEIGKYFQYGFYDDDDDAFTLTIQNVMNKFHIKNKTSHS